MGTRPEPLRWAILGTGEVSRKFALGLNAVDAETRATVLASRSPDAARGFASALGIRHVAGYAEAVAREDVDAVYVASPPSEHEAHAALAVAAGKAVLVEKPFALDAEAASRIADDARRRGVFCMEGMWTRFLPLLAQIRALIAEGALGTLRAFEGSFVGNVEPDASTSVFDPVRGGGALMHRGVYPLSLARHLLGPITSVRSLATVGHTGVDEHSTLLARHEGGALSTICAGLRATGTNRATLYGSLATLDIAAPVYRPFKARLISSPPRRPPDPDHPWGRLSAARESTAAQRLNQHLSGLRAGTTGRRIAARFSGNGYGHEALAVAEAVSAGWTEHPLMPLAESVEIMSVIDRARAQWAAQEQQP